MNWIKYDSPRSILTGTTQRQQGHSAAPYDKGNLAFYVGDDPVAVLANRRDFAQAIQRDLNDFIFPKITHSKNFAKVTSRQAGAGALAELGSIPDCDALYSFDSQIVLAVFHADCCALSFYHEARHLIAVLHAGWPGIAQENLTYFLNHLKTEEAIDLSELHVRLAPSIAPAHYEVGQDVIQALRKTSLSLQDALVMTSSDHGLLDIAALNIQQCIRCGIPEKNIIQNKDDVFENSQLYYSYRRQHSTGRQITFITQNDPR